MIPLRRVFEEKRRLIMPLLIALLANVALYAFAVYPLERRAAGARQRAENARNARLNGERELAAAKGTIEGTDRADQELKKFYQEVLPRSQAAARRVTYLRLARLAREAELGPGHTARFEPIEIRDSRLTRLRTTLDLQGSYRAIRRFIYLLETSPEFMIIENVSLSQAGAGDDGGLQVTLELSTYYSGPASGSDGD
jgi:hypothetical protein